MEPLILTLTLVIYHFYSNESTVVGHEFSNMYSDGLKFKKLIIYLCHVSWENYFAFNKM